MSLSLSWILGGAPGYHCPGLSGQNCHDDFCSASLSSDAATGVPFASAFGGVPLERKITGRAGSGPPAFSPLRWRLGVAPELPPFLACAVAHSGGDPWGAPGLGSVLRNGQTRSATRTRPIESSAPARERDDREPTGGRPPERSVGNYCGTAACGNAPHPAHRPRKPNPNRRFSSTSTSPSTISPSPSRQIHRPEGGSGPVRPNSPRFPRFTPSFPSRNGREFCGGRMAGHPAPAEPSQNQFCRVGFTPNKHGYGTGYG